MMPSDIFHHLTDTALTEVREHRLRTFSDAGNEVGSLVDPPEQRSIVHDVPDPVCNLLEPDVLVTEGIAEKGLRGVQAERPQWLTRRISIWSGYSGGTNRS